MGSFGSGDEVDDYQRKHRFVFVLPRLQLKFILLVFFSCTGLILFSYLVMNYLMTHQILDLVENSSYTPEDLAKIINTLNVSVGYWALICVLFTIMVISFSFFYTHRVAGPIYHMNRVMMDYFSGNTKARVHLRKGDEFMDLETSINRLIESLEKSKKS